MLWTNPAIVLSARPFGEGKAIASVLTEAYGSWRGMVPGGGSAKKRALLQPGGFVAATWRARCAEQLGVLTLELAHGLDARILDDRLRLAALIAACSLLDSTLPEREPNGDVYHHTRRLIEVLGSGADYLIAYIRWETLLVAALGFGVEDGDEGGGGAGPEPQGFQRRCSLRAQLDRTGSVLEACVFAGGPQRLPSARRRLVDLIDEGAR